MKRCFIVYRIDRTIAAVFTTEKKAKGILRIDEEGCLYAESIDNFTFYNHIQVRGGKYAWQSQNRKSIKRFGTGFIYK